MKNATSAQKGAQLHLSVYSALEKLGIAVPKSRKAKNKRRSRCSGVKSDFARGRLCSTSCEKEDYPFVVSPKQKLFGIALNSVEWDMDRNGFYAPKFLIMATEYLLAHQKFEGLFRKAGATNRLKALRTILEDGGNFNSLGVTHVYDVACILKQWLRELPEPLIPYGFHEVFLKCYDIKLDNNRLKALCLTCLLLPSEHLRTLMYVLKFLATIAAQESNKMDAYNLAVVISPCLMPLPKLAIDGETTKLLLESRTQITKLLIIHSDLIGKTEWLEEILSGCDVEATQDKAKVIKCASKPVHSIFSNLRKRIHHTRSPSPKASSKFERPLFYSQRREKKSKALHTPCALHELDGIINVQRAGLKPLQITNKQQQLHVTTSTPEDEIATHPSSSVLSPLLNITNSSFSADSPFSRPNKTRLENEQAWVCTNPVASETVTLSAQKMDKNTSALRQSPLMCQEATTPIFPRHLVRPLCRRAWSLQYGPPTCRQISKANLNLHDATMLSKLYKSSDLPRSGGHSMKAKYRRDRVRDMRSMLRSTSSPASYLEVLKATAELEKRGVIASTFKGTCNLLHCTGTKCQLRRGRPNTVHSGLPSPAWTKVMPADRGDSSPLSWNETISAAESKDADLSKVGCNSAKEASDNLRMHERHEKHDRIPHALGAMEENTSPERSSPTDCGFLKTMDVFDDVQKRSTRETKTLLHSTSALENANTIIKESDSDLHDSDETIKIASSTITSDKCTSIQSSSSSSSCNESDMVFNAEESSDDISQEQWVNADSYFNRSVTTKPATETKTETKTSNVRESILLLRTRNAGKVQAKIQLYDTIASAFSAPGTFRRGPKSPFRSDVSKNYECKTYLEGFEVFPNDDDDTDYAKTMPRATLFNYPSDLNDVFSSTENLLLSRPGGRYGEDDTTDVVDLNKSRD